ncbi:MAG: T9SS type A sorting domain-containing protein [Flavipsychrobacter sp.]
MKRTFIITLLMLWVNSFTIAQPILQNVVNYSVGDSAHYYTCDTIGYSSGGSGASQVWDYSNLNIVDSFVLKVLDKNNAPSGVGSQFAKANIAETSMNADVFVENTATKYSIVGVVAAGTGSGLTVINYTDPQIVLQRSLGYQMTFVDTFSVSYNVSSFTVTGTGYSTTETDGYGTLKLKSKQYNNVLRARVESVRNDTMQGISPPNNIITTHSTMLLWFDSMHKEPLMRVDSVRIVSSTFSNKVFTVSMLKETGTTSIGSEQKMLSNINCYGESGILMLSGLTNNKQYSVALYSSLGRKVLEHKFTANSSTHSIADNNIMPGFYILHIIEKGKQPTVIKLYCR